MLQLFCAQQLQNANQIKMVDFQSSWDSLNLDKLSLKVKSKRVFFSERQSNFKEKTTLWASYIQKMSEFEFSSIAEET